MSDFYLEFINDTWKTLDLPGPYLLLRGTVPTRYLLAANRIWRENTGVVYFIKNRGASIVTLNEKDLEEFFWVKLRAHCTRIAST